MTSDTRPGFDRGVDWLDAHPVWAVAVACFVAGLMSSLVRELDSGFLQRTTGGCIVTGLVIVAYAAGLRTKRGAS